MLPNKYLNKYYKKYGILLLIGILATIIVDYAQLYIPEYLGVIVNLFNDEKQVVFSDIEQIVINLIIVAFVLFVGRFLWRICIFYASGKIDACMRHEMFLKAERLSQRFYHENKTGSITAWFSNDLENVEDYLGWGTIMSVDAIFLSSMVVVKMVKLDPVLSLVTITPMILLIFWGALVEKFMTEKWEARQKAFDDMYDFAQENFAGIRVIKAFVKETQEIHAFAKIARKNADKNLDFAKTSVLFDVAIEVIIAVIMAVVLGLGSYFVYCFVNNNPVILFGHVVTLNAGTLTTFIGYADELIWPMIAMGQMVSMRSRAKTSLKRVTDYLDEPEEIIVNNGAIKLENCQGKIAFNRLSFNYPDSPIKYLKDISLEIQPGEMIGIIGKIGSGKTSLVNALLRLYNLEKGQIMIDDIDIMDLDIDSLRDNIAYVPQDNFLFSQSIKNNISFSNATLDLDTVMEAARFADIDSNIRDFAQGYDTTTGERGVTLSGGQKQRISIARAYVKNSPIMIMDDSVSAVDVKTEETILNNIMEKRQGKTTLIIASRVSTLIYADKIIVLKDGELEAFGTPSELMKTSPTYQKMCLLQQLDKEVKGGNQ